MDALVRISVSMMLILLSYLFQPCFLISTRSICTFNHIILRYYLSTPLNAGSMCVEGMWSISTLKNVYIYIFFFHQLNQRGIALWPSSNTGWKRDHKWHTHKIWTLWQINQWMFDSYNQQNTLTVAENACIRAAHDEKAEMMHVVIETGCCVKQLQHWNRAYTSSGTCVKQRGKWKLHFFYWYENLPSRIKASQLPIMVSYARACGAIFQNFSEGKGDARWLQPY